MNARWKARRKRRTRTPLPLLLLLQLLILSLLLRLLPMLLMMLLLPWGQPWRASTRWHLRHAWIINRRRTRNNKTKNGCTNARAPPHGGGERERGLFVRHGRLCMQGKTTLDSQCFSCSSNNRQVDTNDAR